MAPRSLQQIILLFSALVWEASSLYDPDHRVIAAKLYGDLEEYKYYYMDLLVGNPPQRASVVVDTGSGLTAFSCTGGVSCGFHLDNQFEIKNSTTGEWVGCQGCHDRCEGEHCCYKINYSEGTSVAGSYFEDYLHLGDPEDRNPRQKVRLGCHTAETRYWYAQKANGVMGLKPPSGGFETSILPKIWGDSANVDSGVLSLCFSAFGGAMLIGGWNSSWHRGEIQWVDYHVGSQHWGVTVGAIVIGGEVMTFNGGAAIVDSATSYVSVEDRVFQTWKRAVEEHCARTGSCGVPAFDDLCWLNPTANFKGFPDMDFHFGANAKVTWTPEAYMIKRTDQKWLWCMGVQVAAGSGRIVLGAAFSRLSDTIYDHGNSRIGFVRAECPENKVRPQQLTGQEDITPPVAGGQMQKWNEKVVAGSKHGRDSSETRLTDTQAPGKKRFSPAMTDFELMIRRRSWIAYLGGLLLLMFALSNFPPTANWCWHVTPSVIKYWVLGADINEERARELELKKRLELA